MADATEKKRTLRSSDGKEFEVEEAVAMESKTIRHLIEDGCDGVIPLPNVSADTLSRVIEYCRKHAQARGGANPGDDASADAPSSKADEADLKTFDEIFVEVDQATLYDLILAANYLDIKGLLELTCQEVADIIDGKTVEEIRKAFNIKSDFTPDEEEEIRRQNPWAFE